MNEHQDSTRVTEEDNDVMIFIDKNSPQMPGIMDEITKSEQHFKSKQSSSKSSSREGSSKKNSGLSASRIADIVTEAHESSPYEQFKRNFLNVTEPGLLTN